MMACGFYRMVCAVDLTLCYSVKLAFTSFTQLYLNKYKQSAKLGHLTGECKGNVNGLG